MTQFFQAAQTLEQLFLKQLLSHPIMKTNQLLNKLMPTTTTTMTWLMK